MKRSVFRLAALLMAAVLLFSGCGGGTTSSGTASGTASGTVSGTVSDTTGTPGGNTTPTGDPVAQWRVTPTTISKNPADPDFRLDAKNYESIEFPAYNKNNPARLPENTYTDEEKQKQRIAGQQLKVKITQAVIKKETTMTIDPGVYRFPSSMVPFDLTGASNITFLGEGVELVLEGFQQAIKLNQCENITFVGFTVDRDPYRHTQFTVQDYNWTTQEMTVQVWEGYDPDDAPRAGDLQFFDDNGVWRQHVFTHFTKFRWVDEANRIGVYEGVDPVDRQYVDQWIKGTIGATILGGEYHVINMNQCKSCNFVDIVNYGGSMMSNGGGNSGDFYYLRNKDIVRPGTNSLIAGGWGLVGFIDGGPIIEDCIYSRTNDDAIDVLAWTASVLKQESAKTILVATMPTDCQYKVGDTLRLYKAGEGDLLCEPKITAVEELKDEALIDEAVALFTDDRWQIMGNHESVFRITLDQEVTVGPLDAVENYTSFRPEHIVIKGTLFHDIFCRLLLQSAKSMTIENNVVLRTGLSTIQTSPSSYGFAECTSVENITIKGNTFVSGPYSPQANYGYCLLTGTVAIGMDDFLSSAADPNPTRPLKNIVIEDNWIRNSMFAAIQIKDVVGLTIRNNRIDAPCTYSGISTVLTDPENPGKAYYGVDQDAAIFLYNCEDLTVEGNVVNFDGGNAKQEIVKIHCAD